uniref:Uncharacterized protein n=1 Tax=Aegilops tauschii subsp. strangulata TaxID=200361 RepID=A0A453N1J3_AEGTS
GNQCPSLIGCLLFLEISLYGIVLFLMIAFAVIPTIGSNTHNVYKVVEARKGSMVLALAMLFPFGLLMAGTLVWVLSISFRYNEKSTTSANHWNWFCVWLSCGKNDSGSLM